MRPVPQIIAALKADATIQTTTSGKIYADHAPQDDSFPARTAFIIVDLQSTKSFASIDNCQAKAYVARIAIEIVCASRGTSDELQELVEDVLTAYTSHTDDPHPIQGITPDGAAAWNVVEPIDGSDERGYWCSQNFQVHYRRV